VPQWTKVLLGSAALIAIAVAPDFYLQRGYHHQHHGTDKATHADASNADLLATPSPTPNDPPQDDPLSQNGARKRDESQVKLTDILLILVGFLQFGAIVGQIVIYCRQAEIMKRQLASMRLAGRTARRVAETLPRVERAYISGGGPAYHGIIQEAPGVRRVERLPSYGALPTIFEVQINNYGKTPGELLEIHIGWLDEQIPDIPPPITKDNVVHFQDWVKPDTASRTIFYLRIPRTLEAPIIYGRIYYKDIIEKRLHSSGFILKITSEVGTEPIRASVTYTEERDEANGIPEPLPAPLPERRHEVPQPATTPLPPPR
jgi:hypothetical protein